MPRTQPPRRPVLLPLVMLVVAAAALRAGVITARWDRLSADPDAYRVIAENLARHGTFSRTIGAEPVQPTAFRPPLYPMLLTAVAWRGQVAPVVVAVIHVLAGSLTVVLVWVLGQRCGWARKSYLAALLVAVDPILLNQSSEVMTETVATLLTALALLALVQWSRRASVPSALLAGGALGLAVLCRPTFLAWGGLCGLAMLVVDRTGRRALYAGSFAVAFAVVLAPWGLRNLHTFGRPIVTTTHGGYTLLLGNNPSFYQYLRSGSWGSVWDANELQPLLDADAEKHPATVPHGGLSEREADRRLYDLARQTIREQPAMFLYASVLRLGNLWSPLAHRIDPHETRRGAAMRWTVAAWYVISFIMMGAGIVRLRFKLFAQPWLWGTLCVLTFMLVHSIYWTNMRMRAPLTPIIALVAAAGVGKRPD